MVMFCSKLLRITIIFLFIETIQINATCINIATLFNALNKKKLSGRVVVAVPKKQPKHFLLHSGVFALGCLLIRPLLKKIVPSLTESYIETYTFGKIKLLDCIAGCALGTLIAFVDRISAKYFNTYTDQWELFLIDELNQFGIDPALIGHAIDIIATDNDIIENITNTVSTQLEEASESIGNEDNVNAIEQSPV
jgi:hypothetical protein